MESPLDFEIQKRIVSAETIWGNMVYESVTESKQICIQAFCPSVLVIAVGLDQADMSKP